MDLQPPTASCQPGKKPVVRFFFNIQRDIEVLQAVVSVNPIQLGKQKWAEVSTFLKDAYNYDVKPRTVKERIDLLVKKLQKEELESKTGTEEQKIERVELLQEIITRQEQENCPVTMEIGADTQILDDGIHVVEGPSISHSTSNQSAKKRQLERVQADEERAVLLAGTSSLDSAPSPSGIRKKRTRACREDDLIAERHKHDMQMEVLKLKQDEEWKQNTLLLDNRKLDLEMEREHKIRDENQRRDEYMRSESQRRDKVMLAMCSLIKGLQSNMQNSNK